MERSPQPISPAIFRAICPRTQRAGPPKTVDNWRKTVDKTFFLGKTRQRRGKSLLREPPYMGAWLQHPLHLSDAPGEITFYFFIPASPQKPLWIECNDASPISTASHKNTATCVYQKTSEQHFPHIHRHYEDYNILLFPFWGKDHPNNAKEPHQHHSEVLSVGCRFVEYLPVLLDVHLLAHLLI